VENNPLEDSEHIDSLDCWCKPDVIFETDDGSMVIVHKAPGDELPPASIIAQAIADVIAGR
jgi:hypothetical protein